MQPIILFDIDRTLFDTSRFVSAVEASLLKFLQLPEEKLKNIGAKYSQSLVKNTDFDPEEYLKHLVNHLKISHQKNIYQELHNIYFSVAGFSHSLYPDVIPTLHRLKESAALGIYSEGNQKFQTAKLIKSGLMDLFDSRHIYIFRRKTELPTLSRLPDHVIIVDDNQSVIDELFAQQVRQITPIWLNRLDSSRHHFARTIHSLTELI